MHFIRQRTIQHCKNSSRQDRQSGNKALTTALAKQTIHSVDISKVGFMEIPQVILKISGCYPPSPVVWILTNVLALTASHLLTLHCHSIVDASAIKCVNSRLLKHYSFSDILPLWSSAFTSPTKSYQQDYCIITAQTAHCPLNVGENCHKSKLSITKMTPDCSTDNLE